VPAANLARPGASQGSATVSGMGHRWATPRLHRRPAARLRVDELDRAGCYREVVETASVRTEIPVLGQVPDQPRPGDAGPRSCLRHPRRTAGQPQQPRCQPTSIAAP
jgi:hypothetical protein